MQTRRWPRRGPVGGDVVRPPGNTALSAARRARELAELAGGRPVDLLVVGLGVTGAGVALDAAARGLSVAAVDAHDIAFGTSRFSSKLVHGGLRYLASGQFGVAYESAMERDVLMRRTAAHLIRPLPFVLPEPTGAPRRLVWLADAGFLAGDLLRAAAGTPTGTLPRTRRLDRGQVARAAPALRADRLRAGWLTFDGQLVDDVRLVVALCRTAAGFGARVLTRCRVLRLSGTSADIRDEHGGGRLQVRARAVVNAAGVWAGQLVDGVPLRPSRGTHLVLAVDRLADPAPGLMVPLPGERNRFVIVLPQPDRRTVYVGLTDVPVPGPLPDVAEPPETDVGFLLDVLNSALREPVRRADVVGAFAGLRPLLAVPGRGSADLSRRHAVLTSPDGVVTVVGGKLTTYRRMAEDAVDAAVRVRRLAAGPCVTTRLPLVGSGPAAALAEATRRVAAALPGDAADRPPAGDGVLPQLLVRRYGTEAPRVLEAAGEDPAMRTAVATGLPWLRAELLWGVRREGALDSDDLLDRRTRIGLLPTARQQAVPAAQAALATAGDGAR